METLLKEMGVLIPAKWRMVGNVPAYKDKYQAVCMLGNVEMG
jgi:hypothetical protein